VFEYRHSSDDEMLSADDIESTDDSEYQMEDPTFETPGKAAYHGYSHILNVISNTCF
jgi:hypothetical protein